MPDSTAAPSQHCTIDFLEDTLFGVNPLSHDCTAQITQAGDSVSLRLLWPWPKALTEAHNVSIKTDDHTYHGVLVDAQAFGTDELLLKVDLKPEAAGAH